MICLYIRSSSIGSYSLCPMQYFLQYNLDIQSPPKSATTYGSVVHKVYEWLALKQLAKKRGQYYIDGEDAGKIHVSDCVASKLIVKAFDYYKNLEQPNWTDKDFAICKKVLYNALYSKDSIFHPDNLNIIEAEQRFDFELPYEWAKIDYKLSDDIHFKGQLSCKGAMDLITSPAPGIIEYLDLKTGSRKDWGTGQVKDFDYLMEDKQLMLYYLALCKLYPDAKQIIMSIYYCKPGQGGMHTLPYTREMIPDIENMLRKYFEAIRDMQVPELRNDGVCTSFCYYGTNNHPDSGKTICKHYHDIVSEIGINNTVMQHGNVRALSVYGSGGGKQAKGN